MNEGYPTGRIPERAAPLPKGNQTSLMKTSRDLKLSYSFITQSNLCQEL